MDKSSLRKIILNKRNLLSSNYIENSSKIIFEKIEKLVEFKKANSIFIYLSFGSEVITDYFINDYIDKKDIFVPKIVGDDMKLVRITRNTNFSKNKFGILEPNNDDFYDGIVDLVITPSLVFDKSGYRLGYGKGYYDKYFSLNKYKYSIGVCFNEIIVSKVPREYHDVKVNRLVTESLDKVFKNFVVTTSVKITDDLREKAQSIATYFDIDYLERKKLTIKEILKLYENVLVVYKDNIIFIDNDNNKLFFHLDTAMIRIKNNNEPLIEIISEKEQSILDLTMGLARDSIVLSYYGHNVTSLEENEIIYFLVKDGLENFSSGINEIDKALRKIKVYNINNLTFLKECEDNSYDVVYADPMFDIKIKESTNLSTLEKLASQDRISEELFAEMTRVARKKVIIKAHNLDPVFDKFNLIKYKRAGAKFSFGILEL
ncbi:MULTISPECIES: 5-formyltetrahydrofolate cyclo-ligase [unclassified Gemella]|uniref:5-formyltetrahydrofolate cyclo-ligase n=1 Tax=unclassified Gemella TaxID=2624949 RepID=UPI001D163E05|nr:MULTISPECIES: 5-formyltetrahydrofolate cyclo-ligase [unclassified Gemella]